MMLGNKSDLRRRMKQVRSEIPPEIRAVQNQQIAKQVLAHPAWQKAHTIFCYCSTDDEIDTYPLLHGALEQGKALCLPLAMLGGRMEARRVTDLTQLQPGLQGILEPCPACPVIPPAEISLCIIPCLAADLFGYRLGYGGGYYDRFLVQTNAIRMVLCAESRVFPHIPVQDYDMPCDILVTESKVVCLHEK